MKRLIIFALIVIVLMTMIVTCPSHEEHTKAIHQLVTEVVEDVVKEKTDNIKAHDSFTNALTTIGGSMVSSMLKTGANTLMDNMVSVDNYFIFSFGRVEYKEQKQIVTVGIFGHVFTAPKEMIKKQIEKKFNDELGELNNLL